MYEVFQEGLDIPAPEHLARRALELDALIRHFPSVEVFAPKGRTSGHERPGRDLVPVKLHPFILDELRENRVKILSALRYLLCLTTMLTVALSSASAPAGRLGGIDYC
jgi:hypothetical protein